MTSIAEYIMWCGAVLACACAAPPPAAPLRHPYYMQHLRNPSQGLEYYIDHQEPAFYNAVQHKQDSRATSSRLETLEPDNEVELLPGAQQPQPQPPQQTPVSPGVQGLLPGQRFYIIHPMTILPNAYRPGVPYHNYQPLYVVGAAPTQGEYALQGLPGYQNAVLLDPSGQNVLGLRAHQAVGSGAGVIPQASLGYPRPLDFVYQTPDTSLGYQHSPGAVRLAQLVSLQGAAPAHRNAGTQHTGGAPAAVTSEQERVSEASASSESREQGATLPVRPAPPASALRPAARPKPKP